MRTFLQRGIMLVGLWMMCSVTFAGFFSDTFDTVGKFFDRSRTEIPYCTKGQECSLSGGVAIVGKAIGTFTTETATQYFQRVAGNIVASLGVVGVLFIIYAGFLYLIAAGNDEKTKSAKRIIITVLIGYVIIFLSWSVVAFVTQKILAPTGATPTPSETSLLQS